MHQKRPGKWKVYARFLLNPKILKISEIEAKSFYLAAKKMVHLSNFLATRPAVRHAQSNSIVDYRENFVGASS